MTIYYFDTELFSTFTSITDLRISPIDVHVNALYHEATLEK